jgi:hypothetical protein
MMAGYPNQYPNTVLTLSAHTDTGREKTRTPDLTRSVVARLLRARRQVQAQMWAARSEIIVRQLVAMRGTYPA